MASKSQVQSDHVRNPVEKPSLISVEELERAEVLQNVQQTAFPAEGRQLTGTLMCEVESILNSRSITVVSEDSRDLKPLTPNLLLLKSDTMMPPGVFQKEDLLS